MASWLASPDSIAVERVAGLAAQIAQGRAFSSEVGTGSREENASTRS
jgi:hypothetical protein